ncbi:MAG: cation:proton antiporter [Bacteroidales bacterium]|nr:cation:proton antiporter [Bacteroidales bacterium]
MAKLEYTELITLLLQLSIMLIAARILGEFARKLRQPVIVGEIIAGVILGPSVLGTISPGTFDSIFPHTGGTPLALDGIISLSVILLLFIAGLEIELDLLWKYGKSALSISLLGVIIPLTVGFMVPYYYPELFYIADDKQKIIFCLFFGTSLSITALPVIAKILIDLNLLKSKLGIPIISSAMIDDLIGWIIFSIILSHFKTAGTETTYFYTIILTIGFVLLMFIVGKRILDHFLPWINKNLAWPGGFLSLSLALCFLCAAFTEYIGIHAVFGAFVLGITLRDVSALNEKAKEIVYQFVNNVFAPLFFVSIGLKVNFVTNFDLQLVLIVIVLAFSGKIIGCGLGAYLSKHSLRESLAVGFAMNARGAMEIILGLLALQNKLINESMFVAIVVMALFTSTLAGPFMKLFLGKSPLLKPTPPKNPTQLKLTIEEPKE